MPTYVKIGYTLPAINVNHVFPAGADVWSAWVPITTIPRPATATFFYYWDGTMKLTTKRLFNVATPRWDISVYLQLANAAGTTLQYFQTPLIGSSNTQVFPSPMPQGSPDALAYMSLQGTALNWTAPIGSLTQARVQIVANRSAGLPGPGCDVTVDVVAGTLQVYSEC